MKKQVLVGYRFTAECPKQVMFLHRVVEPGELFDEAGTVAAIAGLPECALKSMFVAEYKIEKVNMPAEREEVL